MGTRYGVIGTGTTDVEHVEEVVRLEGATLTAIADPYEPARGCAVRAAGPVFDVTNVLAGARPARVTAAGAHDVNHLDEVEQAAGEQPAGRPVELAEVVA